MKYYFVKIGDLFVESVVYDSPYMGGKVNEIVLSNKALKIKESNALLIKEQFNGLVELIEI